MEKKLRRPAHFSAPVSEKSCPLCGVASDGQVVFTSPYSLSQQEPAEFSWISCPKCQAHFVAEIPDETSILEHLKTVQYGRAEESEIIHRQKASLYQLILNQVRNSNSTNRAVLDFGCGFGSFMDLAETSGFFSYGVDANPAAVDCLRKKGHRVILGSDVDTAREFGIKFRAVVMNDIVCYLRNPLKSFKNSLELLDSGGVLVLRVSNKRGWLSTALKVPLLRRRAIGFCCYDHFHVADMSAYEVSLQQSGFDEIHVGPIAPSSDISELSWFGRCAYWTAHATSIFGSRGLRLAPGVLITAVKKA